MRNEILNWIGRHERIHYILRCIRHLNDKKFIHEILYPNDDLFSLRVTSNGNKHKGKILYCIRRDSFGFFANFINVLTDMWFADTLGMSPVVVWGDKSPYYEKDGIDGTYNVWEYYFEQYDNYHLDDLNLAFRTTDSVKNVRGFFGIKKDDYYRPTDEYLIELSRIMKKYISLKCDVKEYIEKNIEKILDGKRTLAVQIRMGGMLGNYNGHPIVPSLDEYVAAIREIYELGYDQIFLATDDQRALDRITDEFGNCVVYYSDATRVDGEYSTYCIDSTKEHHNYKCGLEVLLDVYTLARCNSLIAGLSHVSFAARVVKMAYGEVYEEMRLLDVGINRNNKIPPTEKETILS